MNNWYVQILMLVLLLISITCQLEANEQEGAKEAFAEFQNAETTEELAESVTRKTAFEFGAVLLQDAQSFLRYLRRVKPVLEEGARGKIQEKLNETMETYKPENPENTDDRFRKARQSGREFFLDMVEFTNWIAEESDVSPHVNPDMYRKNIPGSNHCTFEKQSNSRVNVILDGDRVEVDGNSYLMSEGVEVVKQDDSWKVDKTGIMRYRNSDETKDRLHLRETLSTSSDPLDSFFEDPGNLPVHGEIKEQIKGTHTARSGSAIVQLESLGINYDSGSYSSSLGSLNIYLPAYPHLGNPSSVYPLRQNGVVDLDTMVDVDGNEYDFGRGGQESFQFVPRFASPDGLGPAMRTMKSSTKDGPAPENLSKISGSAEIFFPINTEKDTASAPGGDETVTLSAGGVEVQVSRRGERQFTVTVPRDKTNYILNLYGLTSDGEEQVLDAGSREHVNGKQKQEVETEKPVETIGLNAGSELFRKEFSFELDFEITRTALPLDGDQKEIGGATFEVVKTGFDEEHGITSVYLRQEGSIQDGRLLNIIGAEVEEDSFRARSTQYGNIHMQQFVGKPDTLYFYIIK